MSQQKSHKKFVILTAIIIAVSAGIVVAVPYMISASLPHKDITHSDGNQLPDGSYSPDSSGTGDVMVGNGLRTKDNTHCKNPPGGPMIC